MDANYRTKNFGIAPRAISYLFDSLREKSKRTNAPYYIRVAYCEIYNEQVNIFDKYFYLSIINNTIFLLDT